MEADGLPRAGVSYEALFEAVWKERYFELSTNTLMVHIRKIRGKLSAVDAQEVIRTVWGVGYKING